MLLHPLDYLVKGVQYGGMSTSPRFTAEQAKANLRAALEREHVETPDIGALERQADATHQTLRRAQGAFELACRDSTTEDLDRDPAVLATREVRDAAQRAHDAAQDRLGDAVLVDPVFLASEDCTPQLRRALTALLDSRGPGEPLATVIRQITVALKLGRRIRVEVIE